MVSNSQTRKKSITATASDRVPYSSRGSDDEEFEICLKVIEHRASEREKVLMIDGKSDLMQKK